MKRIITALLLSSWAGAQQINLTAPRVSGAPPVQSGTAVIKNAQKETANQKLKMPKISKLSTILKDGRHYASASNLSALSGASMKQSATWAVFQIGNTRLKFQARSPLVLTGKDARPEFKMQVTPYVDGHTLMIPVAEFLKLSGYDAPTLVPIIEASYGINTSVTATTAPPQSGTSSASAPSANTPTPTGLGPIVTSPTNAPVQTGTGQQISVTGGTTQTPVQTPAAQAPQTPTTQFPTPVNAQPPVSTGPNASAPAPSAAAAATPAASTSSGNPGLKFPLEISTVEIKTLSQNMAAPTIPDLDSPLTNAQPINIGEIKPMNLPYKIYRAERASPMTGQGPTIGVFNSPLIMADCLNQYGKTNVTSVILTFSQPYATVKVLEGSNVLKSCNYIRTNEAQAQRAQ